MSGDGSDTPAPRPPRAPPAMAPPPQPPQPYGAQVAGHRGDSGNQYCGLLHCNDGKVLKPILKPAQAREAAFYERLAAAAEPELLQLRALTPRYHGTRRVAYGGRERQYLVLEDLAHGMLEPCIMDVKIGKRTWDPLADEEKIAREKSKYSLCRQEYGFCIPGFQVYRQGDGVRERHGKEYGKKLHGAAVKQALRTFLNGPRPARVLLLQFLPALWRLQRWAQRQTALRLYCASLLLVYDAKRLQERQEDQGGGGNSNKSTPSGLRKCQSAPAVAVHALRPPAARRSDTITDKICNMKRDYHAALRDLCSDGRAPRPWATLAVIDFAHAFFNEDGKEPDHNFREGIDSLVAVFEELLKETDSSVR